jgi:sugar O-acyltransferase (sialic acid O-acetyltransferase NeuD family)
MTITQLPLYVLGSSGYAKEVAAYARVINPQRPVFFVDNYAEGDQCITVAAYHERLSAGGESVLGSGRCEIRRKMMHEIRPPFATVIHPSAVVLGEVAEGCVIAPGAVIAPNAALRPHVVVNYNATVGHDSVIGPLSVIGPTAAIGGWCVLVEAVYVGAGALIREKVTLEHDVVIGMGAVVTRNVEADHYAMGVPARANAKIEAGGGWLKK